MADSTQIHRIASLEDERLAPYRSLKERELARDGGLFIAEGEHVVRRLLQSDFPVESVLLAAKRAAEMAPIVPGGIAVYVVPDEMMRHVLGFKFHSGVIAAGRRKPSAGLKDVMPATGPATLLICPRLGSTENLGLIMRIAAAFGVDAMVLGELCCDPFYRQAIRVSMGTVFHLPIVRSEDLMSDLDRLKQEWNVQLAATVLDAEAEPLRAAQRPERLGILLGSEDQGLEEHWITAADRKITIPMKLGTDSLNVAVAAAVFLYHFARD